MKVFKGKENNKEVKMVELASITKDEQDLIFAFFDAHFYDKYLIVPTQNKISDDIKKIMSKKIAGQKMVSNGQFLVPEKDILERINNADFSGLIRVYDDFKFEFSFNCTIPEL